MDLTLGVLQFNRKRCLMTTVSGFSQQSYSSSQAYNQPNISTILDQDCTVLNDSTSRDEFKASRVNNFVIDTLKTVSDNLKTKFSEPLNNPPANSSIICRDLEKTSINWKQTGNFKGCHFALRSVNDALDVLDSVRKALDSKKFKVGDYEVTAEQLTLAVLYDPKTKGPKQSYGTLFDDLEKKVSNAFMKLFAPELISINNLAKMEVKLQGGGKTPEQVIQEIKAKVQAVVFAEYFVDFLSQSRK